MLLQHRAFVTTDRLSGCARQTQLSQSSYQHVRVSRRTSCRVAAALEKTKVLLVGNGGREHALAWKLSQSDLCEQLYVAPGNPGIGAESKVQNTQIDVTNHSAVVEFCKQNGIGLVMVGPEAPLVAGLADDLAAAGIKAFGPTAAAAQLEGSKKFMKDICKKYNIPTAAYESFTGMNRRSQHHHQKCTYTLLPRFIPR